MQGVSRQRCECVDSSVEQVYKQELRDECQKNVDLGQVITVSGSGKHHKLLSAADSGGHLEGSVPATCKVSPRRRDMLHAARCGITISPPGWLGATSAERLCSTVSVQG